MSNNKTEKQGFVITMDEAKEIKFNLDAARKDINRHQGDRSNASQCLTYISRTLNKAKEKRTVTLRE